MLFHELLLHYRNSILNPSHVPLPRLYLEIIYKNLFLCAGDPLDAVILGNHLPYGYTGRVKVKGVMKFIDAGLVDDKLICTQLIPGM